MSIAVGLMREREREREVRFKAYCTVNDGQSSIITFTTNPKPGFKLHPLFKNKIYNECLL
jgi:hypothetical protein